MAVPAKGDAKRLTVLVADGQPLFAEALGRALTRRAGVEALDGYPRSGMQATYAAVTRQPDVAVLDLWLQEVTGLAAITSILAKAPATRVIALGWFHGPAEIARVLDAGAAGFVSKELEVVDIADAIDYVGAGRRIVIDPRFRVAQEATAASASDEGCAGQPPGEAFTPRELEVLRLLGAGLPVEDVAARLDIPHKTARIHLERMRAKTGASSQLQVVAVARERGLLV